MAGASKIKDKEKGKDRRQKLWDGRVQVIPLLAHLLVAMCKQPLKRPKDIGITVEKGYLQKKNVLGMAGIL